MGWHPLIVAFHFILSSAFLCYTKQLHVLFHHIHKSLFSPSSVSPAWHLHLQHPFTNVFIFMYQNYLNLASLTISRISNAECSFDVLVSVSRPYLSHWENILTSSPLPTLTPLFTSTPYLLLLTPALIASSAFCLNTCITFFSHWQFLDVAVLWL